ncbi:acyl-CoA dehydrogenase [Oceanicola sp. 22II-s10i]|uniref:acyl-CoA dehydrogenase family protein n=1 Tax=Oceanicola sp. 22II-s10i TaxID=1317116 RepID=UPI000B5203DE|nr:acyl-CoA dehydrogenase family protein [Oceanicola sp. 22II-s10i]OWU83777.1 acyl-CoA dehydrogenase [Oceanicola sp. 22II-s10i]
MWSFETEPEFQKELDWIAEFTREKIEPLDHVLPSQWNIHDEGFKRLVRPLQAEVKARGLWACHLGPDLGGKGYGQLKLALMNEQFGRSRFGPIVFGAQAPDTGNSEILAHYGTDEQKKKWLEPLLNNDMVSCYAMTEPQGGADPLMQKTTAVLDGDEWVINGEKWFASNANFASFYIAMVVTEPEADNPYRRQSMFIVDADTPGIEIIRDYGYHGQKEYDHAHVRWTNVRVPRENLLGERGDGFVVAQQRLGGGRLHHAMRSLALSQKCLDLTCERVKSRRTKGDVLWKQQMVQEKIADAWIQIRQFRLLVLETAWLHDQGQDWKALSQNVSAVKVLMTKVLHDMSSMAMHLHGSIGITTQMPFSDYLMQSFVVGLADGPTEVHKSVVARQLLRQYEPTEEMFPDYVRFKAVPAARAKLGLDPAEVPSEHAAE